jgi:serine O-acetyltransferase
MFSSFSNLKEDIKTVIRKDPAARNILDVLFFYPGFHAIRNHRLANFFWRHRLRFLARMVSHCSRFLTGIEIHPAATIGRRFFIDHGAGVVIGETAEIGNDVLMYQGAVLGGTTLSKGKRHPTIGDDVVIGAGAIVLGAIVIGQGARIGAGSVVVKPVPAGATVVGIPGRIVDERRRPADLLEHGRLPDPVAEALKMVLNEQASIEERLARLEGTTTSSLAYDELKQNMREILKEFNNQSS